MLCHLVLAVQSSWPFGARTRFRGYNFTHAYMCDSSEIKIKSKQSGRFLFSNQLSHSSMTPHWQYEIAISGLRGLFTIRSVGLDEASSSRPFSCWSLETKLMLDYDRVNVAGACTRLSRRAAYPTRDYHKCPKPSRLTESLLVSSQTRCS